MRLCVLGSPIAHSLSPVIHTAAFAAVGIPATYDALDVDETGFSDAVRRLREGELHGANVTMPHKGRAVGLADSHSSEVTRSGAANTLVSLPSGVAAHNTDVEGVRSAWEHHGLDEDGPVRILGAGGAAAAAMLALEGRSMSVTARRPEAAEELVATLGVTATVVDWDDGVTGETVINATPIGMGGETAPDRFFENSAGWFEMAYASGPTPAERAVAAAGLPVVSGLEMLLAQAAGSFRLWTGRPAPLEAMRRAIQGALTRG